MRHIFGHLLLLVVIVAIVICVDPSDNKTDFVVESIFINLERDCLDGQARDQKRICRPVLNVNLSESSSSDMDGNLQI